MDKWHVISIIEGRAAPVISGTLVECEKYVRNQWSTVGAVQEGEDLQIVPDEQLEDFLDKYDKPN